MAITSRDGFRILISDGEGDTLLSFQAEVYRGNGGDDTILANNSRAEDPLQVYGGAGNDHMSGFLGSYYGGSGNDTISALNGSDIYAGGGNDEVTFGPAVGEGGDTLNGGAGRDSLNVLFTLDTWNAGGRRVTIDTVDGTIALNDVSDTSTVSANINGFETIAIGSSVPLSTFHVIGRVGTDRFFGSGVSDTLDGGPGRDTLIGNGGTDRILGGRDGDVLLDVGGWSEDGFTFVADSGADRLFGGGGHDVIAGRGRGDTMKGGGGEDWLFINGEGATANGGSGSDAFAFHIPKWPGVLPAGSGSDVDGLVDWVWTSTLNGGAGRDIVSFDFVDMTSRARSGFELDIGRGTGSIELSNGRTESLAMKNFENAAGSTLGDTFTGSRANNWLYGNAGDDSLSGRDGVDYLFGGAHNDTLAGNDHRDVLTGGRGDDTVFGGKGRDELIGGAGADILNGGQQNDSIVLTELRPGARDEVHMGANGGHDKVFGFRPFGQDHDVLVLGHWTGGRPQLVTLAAGETNPINGKPVTADGTLVIRGDETMGPFVTVSVWLEGVYSSQLQFGTDIFF